ncbi:unnamed protein product [Chilo suppressalis]|uniref:Lipase n=1 Tax=Chilo suppressalis TaxID=168631 RepID=A0ABN8B0B1_CHISP|nr:unnamed protein product [Chilo suppressalis]
MILVSVLVLCSVVAVRSSPHADLVAQLAKSDSRIAHDILEDASLDVPELVRKYGYPLEVHDVVTQDGYILGVHRIPHGRDRNNKPGPRPVVFLMHGLFSSSADWVVKGPGCSFAYILAEEGFDVWMGNARGTYYSRRHLTLNPNSKRTGTFWRFSWDEIGNRDLPAMIDYALAVSGRDGLHYVGHSQGTTVFFVMGSLRPVYNQKILSMHAFAPVAYMAHNENPVFRFLAPYALRIELALSLIGFTEFLPNNQATTWAGQNFCMDDVKWQPLCTNLIFLLAGRNEEQFNATLLPLKLGHTPAGASSRQIIHYAQGIHQNVFRRFNHGTTIGNILAYGTAQPPDYDLSRITAPVYLHYTPNDPLAHLADVERLYKELPNPTKHRVPLNTFNHVDFIWAIDADTLLYYPTIELIKSLDSHFTDK